MNRFLPAAILLTSVLLVSSWMMHPKKKKQPTVYAISGFVKETFDYCGGAAPSNDQMHPKPVGVAGIKLYIKKGNTNLEQSKPFDSIVSGANGAFKISLPSGEYCLVEDWKKDKFKVPVGNPNMSWDSTCLRKQYDRCDYSLSVAKAEIKDVAIVIPRHCPWTQPCATFTGPLPPAAPHKQNGPKHQE